MKAWIALTAAALVLTACPRAATPGGIERPARDYYPLSVGNAWTYDVTSSGRTTPVTVSILRQEDGFFVDSQGAKLTADAFGVRDDRRYLLQEPVQEGHGWKNTVTVSSTEHYRIVSAGKPCEVPAGKFPDCVVVESQNRGTGGVSLVNTLTFARGVGMVRVNVSAVKDGQTIPQVELALRSFQLAPPPSK